MRKRAQTILCFGVFSKRGYFRCAARTRNAAAALALRYGYPPPVKVRLSVAVIEKRRV